MPWGWVWIQNWLWTNFRPEKPVVLLLNSTFVITLPWEDLNPQQRYKGADDTGIHCHIFWLEIKGSSFDPAAVLVSCTSDNSENLIQNLWSPWKSFSRFWMRQEESASPSLLEYHLHLSHMTLIELTFWLGFSLSQYYATKVVNLFIFCRTKPKTNAKWSSILLNPFIADSLQQ